MSMSQSVAADEQSITMVRVIAAPVASVFEAWTDPALMSRWMVPIFCRIVDATADARPGGRFRLVIVGPCGIRQVISGEYREVVRNHRLVQTWVGEPRKPNLPAYPTLLTVQFREVNSRETEITLRQDQLKTPADRRGNLTGWRMCFRKLGKLLRR